MQNDKELFNVIKETYSQNPSKEFITSTENMLRHKARSINKKSKVIKLTTVTSGILLFSLAFSWLFLFNGKEAITNFTNTYGAESFSSIVLNEKEPLVFIYQTHNVESYIPELDVKDSSKAFSETKNVTLVGEEFSNALKEHNISAIQDNTDIGEVLEEQNLTFADAYSVTRDILQRTLNEHESIKMVFDIHRDSLKRKDTTINIDGNDYARIMFVVSKTADNYEANIAFAVSLHEQLEKLYPGLSRGVLEKGVNPENTYNQDLQNNSVLLNMGGVENTLDETYRTTDALAEAIKEILEEY